MAQLSVNMNVAGLLRNRRGHPWPNVLELGRTALRAGAVGLTLHPRPDERHATADDARVFRKLIDGEFPDRELNIEGYPDARFISLVDEVAPDQVTLVPDAPDQATSDHGWDFETDGAFLTQTIARLRAEGRRISIFVNADPAQMTHAAQSGTNRVELYTGPYGAAHSDPDEAEKQLQLLSETAHAALAEGLGVNAGHDLTVPGTKILVQRVPEIDEVSIGHALFCDALTFGLETTVSRYVAASAVERPVSVA